MKIFKGIVPIMALATLTTIASVPNAQVVAINCEVEYAGWCTVCRNLPEKPKVTKALCGGAAATAYGCCLAGRSFGGGGFGFNV